jgi:hypothetical protein
MASQRDREEKAVTIGTGVGAMVLVLALGTVVLLLLDVASGTSRLLDRGFPWVAGAAGLLALAYVARHRRP